MRFKQDRLGRRIGASDLPIAPSAFGSHLAGLITAQAARIEALENELRELRLTHEGPVTSPESDVTGPGEAAAPTDEPAAPADG